MRHHKTVKKLDRLAAARKALWRTQMISLIFHKRMVTTPAKAKALRPKIEKLITKSRQPGLATRRFLLRHLNQPRAVEELMTVIVPRQHQRPGGYTRIIPLSRRRRGDGAQQVQIEIIDQAKL